MGGSFHSHNAKTALRSEAPHSYQACIEKFQRGALEPAVPTELTFHSE